MSFNFSLNSISIHSIEIITFLEIFNGKSHKLIFGIFVPIFPVMCYKQLMYFYQTFRSSRKQPGGIQDQNMYKSKV